MVDAFVDAGLLVTEDHNDRAPNLIKKYRRTLKRLKLTPELVLKSILKCCKWGTLTKNYFFTGLLPKLLMIQKILRKIPRAKTNMVLLK